MALITDLGVDGGGIAQPRLKNRWRVSFQNFAGDSESLTANAINVERPKINFQEIVLDRYNSKVYIPGKHEFQPVNITFEDDLNGDVTSAVQEQVELQQNLIGLNSAPRLAAAASASEFKFAIKCDLLDGSDSVIETFILEGAYITNVDYGDLDYSASESIKMIVTFRFDIARQNINPAGITGKATGGAGSTGSGFVL